MHACGLPLQPWPLSLTLFYHSDRLPRSRLLQFWCATSSARSLLSLTVVSNSRRHPRSPPLRQGGSLYRRRWAPAMMRWISGFFLVAFHRWMGPSGDELDCWVFAGVQVGVPPVVLRRSLYVIDSTCLPPYNVVRPGASSHCEHRPCHLRLYVCRPCCACVLPAFPSGVRGLRDFQRGLRGVRGALSQALHAVCDAHLVPTLRALHYRVAYAFLSANVPRFAVRVYCVVLRGTHHTLPTRGFRFTDGRRTILDCAAVGAEFALPGVASGSEVLGVWLMPPLLVVWVRVGWVWVGCWRSSFFMLYLFYLECLPMLLSVPASGNCDRCLCHSLHAVPSAYLRPHASACHIELRCTLLFIAEVLVVCVCCLRRVGGVPPLPTCITQPFFFADG
jgi:hypothetical protein